MQKRLGKQDDTDDCLLSSLSAILNTVMKLPTLATAVKEINRHGALLVFPKANRKEPLSLWSIFHPRRRMNWDWSEDVDDPIPHLWHLRERLSKSNKVVYSKWYQGGATFFSRKLFSAMLSLSSTIPDYRIGLSMESNLLLDILENDSPLATWQLREAAEMEGKVNESVFNRALQPLWARFLIVAYGEVDEGPGFPALAIGATRHIFEELWDQSKLISAEARETLLLKILGEDSPFLIHFRKVEKSVARAIESAPQKKVPLLPSFDEHSAADPRELPD